MLNSFEKKQATTQAQKDLVKKLKLERTFRPEIKSLFARMNNDFKISVAATGSAPDARDYKAAWESALNKHYQRVQKTFLGSVTEFNEKSFIVPEVKLFEELLALALLTFRNTRSIAQALFITDTNNSNMQDAISQARRSLAEQDLPIDNQSVADAASTILKRKTNGRVSGIETLETQAPAESTKLFEARTLDGKRPTDTGPSNLRKTWRTIGDSIVRPAHKDANFQTVSLNEPFIVKGQQLMYPGDNFLGATIDNTIN